MKHPALMLCAILGLVLSSACSSPTPMPSAPTIVILSPMSGTSYPQDAEIPVQSKSTDSQGIIRVELVVDGLVVRTDVIPTGKSQPEFQVAQAWKATTPGAHIVIVRATNEKGATGEAALNLTVTAAAQAPTAAPATVAAAPSAPPASAPKAPTAAAPAPTSPPVPTKATAPTVAPGGAQQTLTLTEAQVNALINASLATSQVNYLTAASVSLQNGQIGVNATYTGPAGKTSTGQATVAVSASGCTIHVSVLQATVGPITLTETQKAAFNAALEKAIKSQVAQTYNYTCIDSITIGNGVMTIKYH